MPLRNGKRAATKRNRLQEAAGEQLRDLADDVKVRAEQGLHAAQKTTEAYLDQSRAKLDEWSENLAGYIKARPLQSLVIAAGAGLALALCLRRK